TFVWRVRAGGVDSKCSAFPSRRLGRSLARRGDRPRQLSYIGDASHVEDHIAVSHERDDGRRATTQRGDDFRAAAQGDRESSEPRQRQRPPPHPPLPFPPPPLHPPPGQPDRQPPPPPPHLLRPGPARRVP